MIALRGGLPQTAAADPRSHRLASTTDERQAVFVLPASPLADTTQKKGYAVMAMSEHDGSRDFDFYFGCWQVHNERLRERLVGSDDWESFQATQECRPVIGGYGNIDDFVTDWNGGFRGMTLRLFNRETRLWSIYWASNRTGALEPPVVGSFENGVGQFFGSDRYNGLPVLARFTWSEITRSGARWEQALSTDEGQTWETNWRMQMTRIDDPQR